MQKPYQNQKATVFRRYYSFVLSALCSIYLVSSLFCPLSTSAAVSTTTALDASKRISGGGMHSIILKANGEVLGWGRNQEGQCNIPPAAQSGVVAVAAGNLHSLALKADGTVIAWGSTAYNRCAVPAELNTAIAIAAGEAHSLALRSDGTIVGWGNTNAAALSNLPPGLNHVIAIASTYRHCLALKR
ncbi:MAG: RCC1 domain-containing protein [Peptococcia bacterium]